MVIRSIHKKSWRIAIRTKIFKNFRHLWDFLVVPKWHFTVKPLKYCFASPLWLMGSAPGFYEGVHPQGFPLLNYEPRSLVSSKICLTFRDWNNLKLTRVGKEIEAKRAKEKSRIGNFRIFWTRKICSKCHVTWNRCFGVLQNKNQNQKQVRRLAI